VGQAFRSAPTEVSIFLMGKHGAVTCWKAHWSKIGRWSAAFLFLCAMRQKDLFDFFDISPSGKT
jgi:hypothetical protein